MSGAPPLPPAPQDLAARRRTRLYQTQISFSADNSLRGDEHLAFRSSSTATAGSSSGSPPAREGRAGDLRGEQIWRAWTACPSLPAALRSHLGVPGNSRSSRTPPPSEWRRSTGPVNYAEGRELMMSSAQTRIGRCYNGTNSSIR